MFLFLDNISLSSAQSTLARIWQKKAFSLLKADHKCRHPFRGRGVPKGVITPEAYLIKWVTRGREGSKISKNG